MTSELPKCKTCEDKRFLNRFHPNCCEACNGTGLDLPTIRAALRLSDRVAKARRHMLDHYPEKSKCRMIEDADGEFIKLSDLTESEAGNG